MKRVSSPCSSLLVFTALVGLSVLAPRSAHSTLPALQRAAPKAHRPAATPPNVSLARLPLQFEANRGQTDPRVRYLSRGPGYTLFLTDTDAVLSVTTRVKPAQKTHGRAASGRKPEERATYRRSVVKMSVVGGRKGSAPVGLEELPGKVNYLRGRDPRKWQQHVPTFRKVRQNGVYPGVDLVYYGNQGRLEYDFVVQPGADPRQIRLSYAGADRVEVAKDGDLVLHTGTGELRQHKPLIYQEVDGHRRTVDGRFTILAEAEAQKPAADATRPTQIAFNVAAYDATRPLVIDPEIVFSTFLGCEQKDVIYDVATDADGNPYVTGSTDSSDFPVTVGVYDETFDDTKPLIHTDAFVTKLSSDGGFVYYSTFMGGATADTGKAIAVDQAGNACVGGETGATATPNADFPIVNGAQAGPVKRSAAFVAQLSPDGSQLRYSTLLDGSDFDSVHDLALDAAGKIYVVGGTLGGGFPLRFPMRLECTGQDAFVSKIDPTLSGTASLVYSTYLGGSGFDDGYGIAVDAAGSAYVTGASLSRDFPLRNALVTTAGPAGFGYVTKLSPTGTSIIYSTALTDRNYASSGRGIAVDSAGNAYVTGDTASPSFATPNAAQQSLPPNPTGTPGAAFVAKLVPAGNALAYATYLGGSSRFFRDSGARIEIDAAGVAYVAGTKSSASFPTINADNVGSGGGDFDAFLTAVAADGSLFLYSFFLGGTASDTGEGLALGPEHSVFVAGTTRSGNFPIANAIHPEFGGLSDGFLAKFTLPPVVTLSVTSATPGAAFTLRQLGSDTVRNLTTPFTGAVQTGAVQLTTVALPHTTFNGFLVDGVLNPGTLSGGKYGLTVLTEQSRTVELVYAPAPTVALTVNSSNPDSGVSVGVNPADNGGNSAGITPFSRTFDQSATGKVTLTAPSTAPNGNIFSAWLLDGQNQGSALSLQVSQDAPHTATAVYTRRPAVVIGILAVNSGTGVIATLSPADRDGRTSGLTNFSGIYDLDASGTVTISVPAIANNGAGFDHWVLDGQPAGSQPSLQVRRDRDHTATAFYVTPPTTTLTVNSSNPDSGVQIAVNIVDLAGQSTGTTPFTRSYATVAGVSLHAPATAPNGNAFKQWLVDGRPGSNTTSLTVTPSINHTVTAVYQGAPVSIRVQSQNPASGVSIQVSGGTPTTGQTAFNVAATVGVPLTLTAPATASNGNVFVRWDLPGGTNSTNRVATFTPTAAGTATAVYGAAPRNFALTVKSSNPASGVSIQVEAPTGTGSVPTTFQQSFPKGTSLTLTAPGTAPNGNVFRSWQDAGGTVLTKSARLTVTLAANRTVVAAYGAPTNLVTLTVKSGSPDSGVSIQVQAPSGTTTTATTFQKTFPSGTALTLVAPGTAPNGNVFQSWQDAAGAVLSRTSQFQFTLSTARTVTAVYAPPVTQATLVIASSNPSSGVKVTLVVNGSSSGGATPMTKQLAFGTVVDATVDTPAPGGNVFQKWQRDGVDVPGATDPHIRFTLDANRTYTAVFGPAPPQQANLTVNAINTSGASVRVQTGASDTVQTTPFQQRLATGAQVTLTAAATAPPPTTTAALKKPRSLTPNTEFQKWLRDGQDFSGNTSQSITFTLDADHTYTAVYAYVLNVTTSGTAQNVPITVTPTDRNGNAVGNAPFTRIYNPGVSVTLTAPATLSNGDQFARWAIDGQFQPAGQRSITVRMDINRFVQASYSAASPLASHTVPSANPDIAAKVRVQAGGVTLVEIPAFRKSYPLGTQVALPAGDRRVPGVPAGTVQTPPPPPLSSSGWVTARSSRGIATGAAYRHPEWVPRLYGGLPV